MPSHAFGCGCATHVGRPWRRPEHWTRDEVEYLEKWYGQRTDEAIGRHLGRTALGVFLRAKRLGLHKRAAGFTARDVAKIFGVDGTTVAKIWIARRLLPAQRLGHAHERNHSPSRARHRPGTSVDRYRRPGYWIVNPESVERFIRDHPELVDVDKMPPSPYRDLAARDPWVSLPAVHRLTGLINHTVARLIYAGEIRGRRRGTHWYVPRADVPRIRTLSPEAIDESVFRRQSTLEVRRNRRKGVGARSAA